MIALVTGANRGIGLEVVRQLAELRHTVILGSRDLEKGNRAKSALPQNENIHVMELDVSKKQNILKCFQEVKSRFGRLDILVNNAGINYDTWQNVANANLIEVRETLETNLFGVWEMTQTFLPMMEEIGYGRIVNVSSGAGRLNSLNGGTPGYSLSKTGVNVLTLQFDAYIQNSNIKINSVCPGWVRTEMGGMGATRSVAEGADTIVWLCEADEHGPSGKFFRDRKEISW